MEGGETERLDWLVCLGFRHFSFFLFCMHKWWKLRISLKKKKKKITKEFLKKFSDRLLISYSKMLMESLQTWQFPPILELATINVFHKPPKDETLCTSYIYIIYIYILYRSLSLLNVDFKILALRLETVITCFNPWGPNWIGSTKTRSNKTIVLNL